MLHKAADKVKEKGEKGQEWVEGRREAKWYKPWTWRMWYYDNN